VVPIGTQYTSGFSTWPDTAKNFSPVPPFTPWDFHQSAPRSAITGTWANVSTEFMSVGLPQSPATPGNGGLLRGSPRWPSMHSISADSSPRM
jgi:hypothetical protein